MPADATEEHQEKEQFLSHKQAMVNQVKTMLLSLDPKALQI